MSRLCGNKSGPASSLVIYIDLILAGNFEAIKHGCINDKINARYNDSQFFLFIMRL